MKIKLTPATPEGIVGAKIIDVEHAKDCLKVANQLENGSILTNRYYYKDERGRAALSVLVRTCLGDVEEFEPEDLVDCRVKLELKKEAKGGVVYTNVKKVFPFDDEDELEEVDEGDELEDSDDFDSDELNIEDGFSEDDESDEDDDSFEQPVHETRRRRNIKLR